MRATSASRSEVAWTVLLVAASVLLGVAVCCACRAQPGADGGACPAPRPAPGASAAAPLAWT